MSQLTSKALAILLLLTMLMPALPAQETANQKPADPAVLRVLSYNIHHAEGVDGVLDLKRIASTIDGVRPDIVALQEVDVLVKRSKSVDQAAELAKLTGMQALFGGNIELQGGQYGNAILTKQSLALVANHRLPNIDQGEQRGVLEATTTFQGKSLRILATHFDHRRDPRERLESIAQVNALAHKQPQQPTLLIGDLNASFESDVLQQAIKVWDRTNRESLPTIPVNRPERQIDFVLSFPKGAWEVVEARVLDEAVASDHRPIFVALKLK